MITGRATALCNSTADNGKLKSTSLFLGFFFGEGASPCDLIRVLQIFSVDFYAFAHNDISAENLLLGSFR